MQILYYIHCAKTIFFEWDICSFQPSLDCFSINFEKFTCFFD
nr:MAG TPA: hypothetical protein [Caudoviricetes sp.]